MAHLHYEYHRIGRLGWLRAAVLGANDGIISIASLIIGIAAANTSHSIILLAAVAALVAGAMSMAAGEYVSVSSQADSEKASLDIERKELETDWPGEVKELTQIYIKRGLSASLAHQVAEQLMEHNALEAHARDEIGITDILKANPMQAAIFSAVSFSLGASFPLIIFMFTYSNTIFIISITALISLALLGALSSKVGGAKITNGILRVTFWGTMAMCASAAVGYLFGV